MKRLLLIFIITYFVSLMTACTANKPSPIIIKDVDATSGIAQSEIIEDDDIMFEIQKTLLAKGFQNLDPKVEILKKDDGFRISASLGVLKRLV